MEDAMVRNPACDVAGAFTASRIHNESDVANRRKRAGMGAGDELLCFDQAKDHVVNGAHLRRALADRVQDRLYIGGRLADDLENVVGGLLLLERLRLLAGLLLELLEETGILQRD